MLRKCIEFEQSQDPDSFARGGIPGFQTGIKRSCPHDASANKRSRTAPESSSEHITQELPQKAEPVIPLHCNHELAGQTSREENHNNTPATLIHSQHESENENEKHQEASPTNLPQEDNHDTPVTLFHYHLEPGQLNTTQDVADDSIVTEDTTPTEIRFRLGQTAGQLAMAHAKHINVEITEWTINTAVGTTVPLSSQIVPGVIYKMNQIDHMKQPCCQSHLPTCQKTIPHLTGKSRQLLLWQQEGWVAFDEMGFYMQMAANSYPGCFLPPSEIDSNPDQHAQVLKLIRNVMTHVHESKLPAFVPVLFQGHWFPVATLHQDDCIVLATTPAQAILLRTVLSEATNEIEITPKTIPTKFAADCGFQTVGWMMSCACFDNHSFAVDDHQATHWRAMFQQFLRAQGIADRLVLRPLRLGGVTGAKGTKDQLIHLVTTNGVAEARGPECAEHLLAKLGHTQIQQVLASPRPWMDLKARASMHSIRIVLAEELKAMIQKRLEQPNPVGRKNNKLKQTKAMQPELKLQADQITVPFGVFKQQGGSAVGPLLPSQVNSTSQGILVSNIQEALPYFALQQPLSSEGIGLLVLDHLDPKLPTNHQKVRVPAICKATSEPLIATAALFQLGQQPIVRNVPEDCIQVQESPHLVLRISIYKDQCKFNWEQFCQGPVKQILSLPIMESVTSSEILDVWDRQFLTEQLKKSEPSASYLFMVNIRIAKPNADVILAQSGTAGCYLELRSEDGRSPHPSQQVVWLPKRTVAEVTIAQQANKVPSQLARSGQRYGLRVAKEHAEATHLTHRPDVVYLEGSAIMKFRVGPLPFGSSKISLANLFKKWGWQARPLAPTGPTTDRTGIQWLVQSTSNPDNWIYQASHGDILITPDTIPAQPQQATQSVIASDKTYQSLAKPVSQPRQPEPSGDDPWMHRDPWQHAPAQVSQQQIQTIEANLEKKMMKHLQDDVKMDDDSGKRLADLEGQMQQLTHDMQSFQQATAKQQQSLQQQVTAIDTKVDTTTKHSIK
eukprot:s5_g22.t1